MSDGMTIRLTALSRAIEAWRESKEFTGQVNRTDLRMDQIVVTARKFEAYLRGGEAE
jgi:predicted RNA-binding protein